MKRKIVVLLGVIVALGLAVLTYTLLIKPDQTKDFDRNSAEYKDALARSPKSSLGEAPSGVLTPTEFSKNSNKYLNKEVSLRGILLKLSGNTYALVDVGVKDARGISIYQGGTDLQFDKYAVDTTKSTKENAANTATAKPVIITGVLKTDKPVGTNSVSAKFVASSLKQQ